MSAKLLIVEEASHVTPILAAACGLTHECVRDIYRTSVSPAQAFERFKALAAKRGHNLMLAKDGGAN